jgi:uncharacterized membrane protein YphA (DoxX/SURF4 family)
MTRSQGFAIVVRVTLGVILVAAGVLKAGSGEAMAESIANYRLLPAAGAQILAVMLPWTEIVVGLLLVLGLWVRAAAGVSTGLFGMFSVAVLSALMRGLDIACGCFGSSTASRSGLHTLILDVLGVCAGVYAAWRVPAGESKI